MAQIIPSITSLPLDSSAAPSVEDIQDRLPSICVDYLSHDWSEEDVWASWRSMTRHKHEIANGVRLENASWRTWQKQRNKLKTISPETLNWLKDSDVTWLYGPLHTAQVEPVRPMKVSSTDDKYGLDPGYKKPILKHRTLSEMLTIHQPSSPILEATKQEEDDDGSQSGRPPLVQTKSDTNIVRVRTGGLRHFAPDSEAPSIGQGDANGKHSPVPDVPSSGKKHISFNTFVEQVIAVDEPLDQMSDSSDDDMLSMRSSSSRSSRPSFSRHSSSGSGSNGEQLTIAKIAPTMLKTNGIYHSHLPAMVYAPPLEYRSPQAEQTNFDFPSPQTKTAKQPWSGDEDDEDDFSSVGYDYYDGQKEDGPSHVVRSGSTPQQVKAQSPKAQSPKAQSPKTTPQAAATLRPPGQSGDATPSSISSSASSSNNNLATSPNVPGRSILKVRPPSHAPKDDTPPSPPLNTYFNYTPSAATGIGGMRSAGAYDIPGASGSPTSPNIPTGSAASGEERGRSTSRDRSSLYGRSPSGSSSISTSSMSPGAPRSPNELPSATKQKPAQAPSLGVVAESVGSPMELDQHDEYIPARSETPTPHSSPQIAFRPLKDTSPASLPHHPQLHSNSLPVSSTQVPFQAPTAPLKPSTSNSSETFSPELPQADSPNILSPTISRNGSRATTAHVGTKAAPTISNNSDSSVDALHRTQSAQSNNSLSSNGPAHSSKFGSFHRHHASQGGNGDESDDDGSSIMGRAANIANTAKDLLGALWYGAHADQKGSGPRRQQG